VALARNRDQTVAVLYELARIPALRRFTAATAQSIDRITETFYIGSITEPWSSTAKGWLADPKGTTPIALKATGTPTRNNNIARAPLLVA